MKVQKHVCSCNVHESHAVLMFKINCSQIAMDGLSEDSSQSYFKRSKNA